MQGYFATFPAGTFEIIVKHLKSFSLDELKIIEHDDSSVIFESSLNKEKLIELRYFTNTYLVIDNKTSLVKKIIDGRFFRLMLIREGEPSQMNMTERAKLEESIKHNFHLEPNTRLSRNDFYLMERSSGNKLLTLRLPRAKFKRDKMFAGELRPEFADILCLAAGLKAKHILVDMFAGYGAIPYEAVRGFGCGRVIAVDNKKIPNRHEHPFIMWYDHDSSNLNFIDDNSVDRVITDPPWGQYDSTTDNMSELYSDFMKEVQRVLKPDCVATILSGYKGAEQIFERQNQLRLIRKWNVLVSGKKATIFKLQKSK